MLVLKNVAPNVKKQRKKSYELNNLAKKKDFQPSCASFDAKIWPCELSVSVETSEGDFRLNGHRGKKNKQI